MRVAVIGLGRWGPNLAKVFAQLKVLREIFDIDLQKIKFNEVKDWGCNIYISSDYSMSKSEAVAIATPYQTHYEIAKFFLQHGKHVLIEKPMCSTSDQCRELIELAEKNKLILMVGHTYMYNQAIRDMIALFPRPKQIINIYCSWQNADPPGRSLHDTVWNVAPHAIAIIIKAMRYNKPHATVIAVKEGSIQLDINDNDLILDWIHEPKIRSVVIESKRHVVVFEETVKRILNIYKGGGDTVVKSSNYDFDNPLMNECGHFLECCETGNKPLTPGEDGLAVVNILESLNL